MSKKARHNLYGYKVCYREKGGKFYIRHFMTYTLRQAIDAKHSYIRYPPIAREDGHVLKNPKWRIIPISSHEVKRGIWREVPF